MRALVLGGGGVTGIAWELGMLAGLSSLDIDLSDADLFVGTSAGSAVASMVASGQLRERYEAQLAGPGGEQKARLGPLLLARYVYAMATSRTHEQFGTRMGRLALKTATVSAADRKAVIAQRLGLGDWPGKALKITAVDAHSGQFTVFEADSGVSLIDAVGASCAVPGVWPPAEINGRRYIDGGMRSAVNADLASGYQQIVVIAPIVRGGGPMTPAARQVAALRAEGSHVVLIRPSAAAIKAIGGNVLDPARRRPAAEAGFTQASAEADAVRAVWS
ncbi:patatin-like phospholipase family protein [Catelliglobosispora koreensis]|uniref:patatin-like phospholipase family protein n=1 Tax=Catelliglobosispora koreensis TaxID=129052 RepID=UPI00036C2C1D|nr:patatin-like phospholipase family protein [Catelliglobosispora koreensis]